MRSGSQNCYLCGSLNATTRDHLPPKNLFPEPRPIDLITAPCCEACNEGFSKLDEQFRAYVSMAINVSEVGRNVMRRKVFDGSFKRSPKLRSQIAKGVFQGMIAAFDGPLAVTLITMEKSAFEPFFIRLTKGLLFTFYPQIDRSILRFRVRQVDQFARQRADFDAKIAALECEERGGGVFRFWRGVVSRLPTEGMWVFQFYDAAIFMVDHTESDRYQKICSAPV